jgi:poly(3-hydroxybutyrate) depolymerase
MDQLGYQLYEMAHLALAPARAASGFTRNFFKNPFNPLSNTLIGRNIAASAELFERMTRRYGKPDFDLDSTMIESRIVPVTEEVVWERPFCRVIRFAREMPEQPSPQPKLLIVAPMSGHYATLLRGTVEAFLATHDVHITDWTDARMIPDAQGKFDLDDYIDYLIEILAALSERKDGVALHALGVCQPSVPLICAVALMEARDDPDVPTSMTLMGGPIDTRRSPTAVNKLAEQRGVEWFRRNCIHRVPFPYQGAGRQVYPGFLQLSGFMAMNMDRHVNAHLDMFNHLVDGDGDSAEKHREFYDEYLAVMDLTAEFYLQTVETVFVRHDIPKGAFMHGDALVDLSAIRKTALMTVEGERDDVSGIGQTYAAQDLCSNIPAERKRHHLQSGVGHYGVFNGARFRDEIAPRICAFHSDAGASASIRQ